MKPLIAYYGDDFTGSTDVMEVLQWAGLRTVLFLQPPQVEQLAAFDNLRAFGIAGWSRNMSPDEMDVELRPALQSLHASGADFVHYKTCSTFDSSPNIGSIGKALELGREVCGTRCVPILVGTPRLGRYQAFGNLFARSGHDRQPCRLDRHPNMQHHPITPMLEADIREHLKQQTDLKIALFDCLQLEAIESVHHVQRLTCHDDAILFDTLYERHVPIVGSLVTSLHEPKSTMFVLGSSGIESALTSYWEQTGQIESLRSHAPIRPAFGPVKQLLAITGSCSPVNDPQIRWAENNGFEALAIRPAHLIDPKTCAGEIKRAVEQAVDILRRGTNLIVHSARGPRDPRIAETRDAFRKLGFSDSDITLQSGRVLGPKLGQILQLILTQHPLTRVGIAGGDTSGYIARELALTALEAIAFVVPGSPLCRGYTNNSLDGIELVFKGGQVGQDNFWGHLRDGSSPLAGHK